MALTVYVGISCKADGDEEIRADEVGVAHGESQGRSGDLEDGASPFHDEVGLIGRSVQPQADGAAGGEARCYAKECDDKEPYSKGCTADARVVAKKDIVDDLTGTVLGNVTMHYSPACSAQWGEVYSDSNTYWSKVALRSPDGNKTYSYPKLVKGKGVMVRTKMQATPNAGYRADGAIQGCEDGCDVGGYSWVIW